MEGGGTRHSLSNPHRFFFPPPILLTVVPSVGKPGGVGWEGEASTGLYPGHWESWRRRRLGAEIKGSGMPPPPPTPSPGPHCLPDLGLGGEGGKLWWGWMEIRPNTPPAPTLSNLYPPLTLVPQCVAEIRASGQSPHSLPPKNILKLSPPFA